MAFACMTEVSGQTVIAIYHTRDDAQKVAFGKVVEVNSGAHFHATAETNAKRIGVLFETDQSYRQLRPLFGEV